MVFAFVSHSTAVSTYAPLNTTLADNAASSTLPTIDSGSLVSKIQQVRNYLKYLLDSVNSVSGDYVSRTVIDDQSIASQLITKKSIFNHVTIRSSVVAGHYKLCTITITNKYINRPLEFSVAQRATKSSARVMITFESTSDFDPTLDAFTYFSSGNVGLYIYKVTTSVWELYLSKTEPYDDAQVFGFNDAFNKFPNIVWGTTQVSEVPSGSVAATKVKLNNDTTGNAATATKLATARTIALTGDVTGSGSFDGSGNLTIEAAVTDNSHNHVIGDVGGLQAQLDAKQPIDAGLTALAAKTSTGLMVQTGTDAYEARSLANGTGTTVTNGSGVAGDPAVNVTYGTTAGTACQGNDGRLSDARTPTSHASTATTYGVGSANNFGHAMASSAAPAMNGTAIAGVDNGKYAREGHVHPTDTSRAPASMTINPTLSGYSALVNGTQPVVFFIESHYSNIKYLLSEVAKKATRATSNVVALSSGTPLSTVIDGATYTLPNGGSATISSSAGSVGDRIFFTLTGCSGGTITVNGISKSGYDGSFGIIAEKCALGWCVC